MPPKRLPEWRIYYGDSSVVRGRTEAEWDAAPDEDVQVVVLMVPPAEDQRRWKGITDRQLWTGDDEYCLNVGWSMKRGRWMDRSAYDTIWSRACGDD